MWITMDIDLDNEEYGLLPAGKNRNVNDKLALELIENGKAHEKGEKAIKPKKNKMVTPKENK